MVCGNVREGLTTTGIILDEKLVQGRPAAADAHHDRGTKDAHQAQFLRFAELQLTSLDPWFRNKTCKQQLSKPRQVEPRFPRSAVVATGKVPDG